MIEVSLKSRLMAAVAIVLLAITIQVNARTIFVLKGGNDYNVGYGLDNPRFTIAKAIADAVAGDSIQISEGYYNEKLVIDKQLVIMGVGNGADPLTNTIIAKPATYTESIVTIEASGSATHPLVLKNLRIEVQCAIGLQLSKPLISYITLDSVVVMGGTSSCDGSASEVGLNVDTWSSLSHLTMTNCAFEDLDFGWHIAKDGDMEKGLSNVDYVTVSNTIFRNNIFKGLYAEKLSHASFDYILVDGNGRYGTGTTWNSGFDFNLMGETDYQDITITNSLFSNNGYGCEEGGALMIKALDDGDFFKEHPATLSGVLVESCDFNYNERAIRIGHPYKNNQGPAEVVIRNCNFEHNAPQYNNGGNQKIDQLSNYSQDTVQAKNNWWNTADEKVILDYTHGLINITPWLRSLVSTAKFDFNFNPQPRLGDDYVAVDLQLDRRSVNICVLQFDLTVPRYRFMLNDVTLVHYAQSGEVVDLLSVNKKIIDYSASTVTYRFVLTPKSLGFMDGFHIQSDVEGTYIPLKLKFKKSIGTDAFRADEKFAIRLFNIVAVRESGSKIKMALSANPVVCEKTLTHTFKPSGDINNSGAVDVKDLMLMINHVLEIRPLVEAEFVEADLNRDDVVDALDEVLLLNLMSGISIPIKQGAEVPRLVIEKVEATGAKFVASDAIAVFIQSATAIKIVNDLGQATVLHNYNSSAVSIEYTGYAKRTIELANTKGVEVYRVGYQSTTSAVEEEVLYGQVTKDGAVLITNPLGLATLKIFSADGALVDSRQISDGQIDYREQLSAGVYYYTISNNSRSSQGRFIIVK